MVNARIEIWLEATSQTKIWEEIFETLHYQAYSASRWKGDYLRKDVANIGGQFQRNMLGFI
jgi:hypothetical protein